MFFTDSFPAQKLHTGALEAAKRGCEKSPTQKRDGSQAKNAWEPSTFLV